MKSCPNCSIDFNPPKSGDWDEGTLALCWSCAAAIVYDGTVWLIAGQSELGQLTIADLASVVMLQDKVRAYQRGLANKWRTALLN